MSNTQKAGSRLSAQEALAEKRRHPRTRDYGPQQLSVTFTVEDGTQHTVPVILWDFSEGGMGMESPRAFSSGQLITITGELHGTDYSMAMRARARIAYCRHVDAEFYRVGVAFVEVTYHRLNTRASQP